MATLSIKITLPLSLPFFFFFFFWELCVCVFSTFDFLRYWTLHHQPFRYINWESWGQLSELVLLLLRGYKNRPIYFKFLRGGTSSLPFSEPPWTLLDQSILLLPSQQLLLLLPFQTTCSTHSFGVALVLTDAPPRLYFAIKIKFTFMRQFWFLLFFILITVRSSFSSVFSHLILWTL